jgi:DNA-binding transcriptional MocR family regulator
LIRNAATPKYTQLAAICARRSKTASGRPRAVIPSERQLETLYGVSRTTTESHRSNWFGRAFSIASTDAALSFRLPSCKKA